MSTLRLYLTLNKFFNIITITIIIIIIIIITITIIKIIIIIITITIITINLNIALFWQILPDYNKITFVNSFISCFGIFGNSSEPFLQVCSETGIDNRHLKFIISKLSNIIIHTTYYIFCMRNRPWCNPELLNY